MRGRRIQIAVVGAAVCSRHVEQLAEQVGRELGRHGATLVCGGLQGVMEAAARGARSAGGLTIGVIPSYDSRSANPWLDVVIATGFGHGRNIIVVASGDAVIALPGEQGTASEIALALKLGKPVVALGAWETYEGILRSSSPAEAVGVAFNAIEQPLRT